jgi:predicted phage terminase large subunit-like protein
MAKAIAKLERFCPHKPWPKQRAFLDLDCKEAFYGGAAAGGKSEALLMAALQFVHVPGYAALILRRDTPRLKLAGGLIPRSFEWLAGKGPTWNGSDSRWTFPTGGAPATLSFGYLRESSDKYRYGSSEYQFIAFDELTEFPEDDYLFLFSRLRRTVRVPVPLRMRSASNPGGVGHAWVKQRFICDEALAAVDVAGEERPSRATGSASVGGLPPHEVAHVATSTPDVFWKNGIAYVPARIDDNPAVDAAAYRDSLSHLPPVVRQRLMNGDWAIGEEGLIRQEWLRYYDQVGRRLDLLDKNGRELASFDERSCRRFATIDPAGTSADRAKQKRGRPPSWSVIEVWDQPRGALARFMILRHVWRGRVGFDGLCHALRETWRAWRPQRMYIENEKLGQAAVDVLGGELPIQTIPTAGRDKVTRAAPLIVKLERGEVFLPRANSEWLADLETELLCWTGLDEETTDQIDAAAYAAQIVAETTHGGAIRMEDVFWK